MEEKKKQYAPNQMIAAMAPNVYKVLSWILSWQNNNGVIYYEQQFKKALRMESDEIERCIQTLIDNNILVIANTDGKWVMEPNPDTFKKWFETPLSKIMESDKMLTMATEVTWKRVEKQSDEMSDDELKQTIMRLQAMLNEREQTKELVRTTASSDGLPWSDDDNDLPW